MKSLSKIVCIVALGVTLLACTKDSIRASDEISIRDYPFSGYTALDVSDNFNVYVTFSDSEEKLEIEANDNLQGYIGVQMEGNKLIIKLKDLRKIQGKETLNVFITTKSISDFKLAGNSKLVFENSLNASNVKFDITGNSSISGSLATEYLDLSSTGNSIMDFEGTAKTVDADLNGNCEFSDYDFVVENLEITLSGNCNAYLTITNSINIDGKGNSVLFYKGDAAVFRQNLSSASKIIKK